MLTIDEIKEIVTTTACEIQTLSGRPIPEVIDGNLKPIGGFQGFDSLNAVEVGIQLAERLGCEIKGNPFADDHKALDLETIAKRLDKLLRENGATE